MGSRYPINDKPFNDYIIDIPLAIGMNIIHNKNKLRKLFNIHYLYSYL